MSLPRAVQAQLDRAAELEQALQQPPADPPQETATPPDPEPKEAPPADPPKQETPPKPPAAPPQDEALAQAYRTLQGKYNSEVPALQRQLAERDRMFAEMQREVAALKEQAARPAQPAPTEAKVDPKDVENFGADLVDMVGRVAATAFAQQAAPLIQRFESVVNRLRAVEEQVKGVGQQQGATAEQLFYADLTRRVPDWETVNADPAWLAWLGEVDPVYGEPRQKALDAASAALSAERAAAIFNAYKATKAPAKPTRPDDLSKQVAPPKSGGAAAPVAAGPREWTRAQILAHYDRVRRGELTPDVEARVEAEINAALAEGRVR